MSDNALPDEAPPKRQRMKPGQRREQILQTLAGMLEQPGTERITTALLAAKLEVSEAALYRHFASKAQMFEGLIDFIEHSLFSLINQIAEREGDGAQKAARMVTVLLQFGEKNPGMARVMVGDQTMRFSLWHSYFHFFDLDIWVLSLLNGFLLFFPLDRQ